MRAVKREAEPTANIVDLTARDVVMKWIGLDQPDQPETFADVVRDGVRSAASDVLCQEEPRWSVAMHHRTCDKVAASALNKITARLKARTDVAGSDLMGPDMTDTRFEGGPLDGQVRPLPWQDNEYRSLGEGVEHIYGGLMYVHRNGDTDVTIGQVFKYLGTAE